MGNSSTLAALPSSHGDNPQNGLLEWVQFTPETLKRQQMLEALNIKELKRNLVDVCDTQSHRFCSS